MLVPFQRILYCCCQEQRIILAASGHQIFSFRASDGGLLSRWSHAKQGSTLHSSDAAEPPEKRRKVTDDGDAASDASSAEIVTENGKKRRRRPKPKPPSFPSVINLCGTKDGKHVVAVTAEDKCLHVLELLQGGELETRSERIMPKRPSAIALTADQQTILCADKFGDVYAMPLLPAPKVPETGSKGTPNEGHGGAQNEPLIRKPAASSLTVFTERNRKALQNQLDQGSGQERKKLEFTHQLLLGHVSLLTDITCVSLVREHKRREYIVTADRDEHIRVSRGLPQPHIIERYCLGHTQFVSKVCCPSWKPELLISGGGDDYLICFDWTDGSIRQRVDIRAEWQRTLEKRFSDGQGHEDLAGAAIGVSGIWDVETQDGEGYIFVACEHFPGLLAFVVGQDGELAASETLETSHNVLDVAINRTDRSLLCSMDTVHRPGTQLAVEAEGKHDKPMLSSWKLSDGHGGWAASSPDLIRAIGAWAEGQDSAEGNVGWLGDLYYGIEHLRKQTQSA